MAPNLDLLVPISTNAAIPAATKTIDIIQKKTTFADLPLEVRLVSFEYLATERTIQLKEATLNIQSRHLVSHTNTTKDPLANLSLTSHLLRNQINYWLRTARSICFISWTGHFIPDTAVFLSSPRVPESSGLSTAMSYRLFVETVQHILLDTRRMRGSFCAEYTYRTIWHFRSLTSLKRFDIRCGLKPDDHARMNILRAMSKRMQLCWGECRCKRGGCEERWPVVRWQVPNRRCGRGKWKVIPLFTMGVWQLIVDGQLDRLVEEERKEVRKWFGSVGE